MKELVAFLKLDDNNIFGSKFQNYLLQEILGG